MNKLAETKEASGLTCSQCGGQVKQGAKECEFCGVGFAETFGNKERVQLDPELAKLLNEFEELYRDMEPEKVQALMEIREIVRMKFPEQFPEACCDLIAAEIKKRKSLNMGIVGGILQSEDGSESRHIWAYDKDRKLYIDVGADFLSEFSDRELLVFNRFLMKEIGYTRTIAETISAHLFLKFGGNKDPE